MSLGPGRPNATFEIVRDVADKPLLIRDLNESGTPSVTNDCEWVIEFLHKAGHLPRPRRLLYFDSIGALSELKVSAHGHFAGFTWLDPQSVEHEEAESCR